MRTDQINPALGQPAAKRIRITGPIINQAWHLLARTARTLAGHFDVLKRRLDQCDFPRRGRVEVGCQRNSLAIDHHHPLCTLSAFGLSDAEPPFLAEAKLPSAKHSSQSRRCCWSSSPSKVRQALSHTPFCSHSKSRLRQVEYEGYSLGRSFHRAPERRTHKMPSKQGRLAACGRPPLPEGLGSGNKGAIKAHCSSLSLGLFIGESFRQRVNHKLR